MGYIRVLFKRWMCYILLFHLCDCNVTFLGVLISSLCAVYSFLAASYSGSVFFTGT
jgi:hypothetical protein